MTIPEKAVQFMLDTARNDEHGYDQGSRWGNPDYDCSSLVITAYKKAGVPLQSTYTGNMRSDFLRNGFAIPVNVDLRTGANLQPGDVLLQEQNHTAMYVGNGQIVHATGNEHGGATGGQPGDQTGREICIAPYFNYNPGGWDYVLRYVREEPTPQPSPSDGGTYIVQKGDTLWGIAERFLGNGASYILIMTANHLTDSMIYPGQELIIPGLSEKKTITITVDEETFTLLNIMASGNNMTIGEVVDKLLEDAR